MTPAQNQSIWGLIASGGFAMIPLVICSLIVWAVIFERLWRYFVVSGGLRTFHLEAINALLRGDDAAVRRLCEQYARIPTADLVSVALDRIRSSDPRLRSRWAEALERQRQMTNQKLRQNLWLLGTIGSAAPFIGLFGTVVGILRSFQEMARTGSGGFAVVASGISESLIATAAGIVVAVIAVMSYNAFQTRWNSLVLLIKIQTEEISKYWSPSRVALKASADDSGAEGAIMAEINITPLTDIFLVLLIIFMVTSSVMSQMGVDVNLPSASQATAQAQPEGVIVSLLPNNELRVNREAVALSDKGRFEGMLKAAFQKTASRLVILEGDRAALLGSAIQVMDLARGVGAQQFAIATGPEEKK